MFHPGESLQKVPNEAIVRQALGGQKPGIFCSISVLDARLQIFRLQGELAARISAIICSRWPALCICTCAVWLNLARLNRPLAQI